MLGNHRALEIIAGPWEVLRKHCTGHALRSKAAGTTSKTLHWVCFALEITARECLEATQFSKSLLEDVPSYS